MKFVCDGLSLSEAVIKVSKACAVRTTTPIYECIKIEAKSEEVTLLATDGELSIRKSFKAEVFEEGAVCVPGKLFSDFIGKLTDLDLTLKTSEKGLEICYLDSGSAIQTLGWNGKVWFNRWRVIGNIYVTIVILMFLVVALAFSFCPGCMGGESGQLMMLQQEMLQDLLDCTGGTCF